MLAKNYKDVFEFELVVKVIYKILPLFRHRVVFSLYNTIRYASIQCALENGKVASLANSSVYYTKYSDSPGSIHVRPTTVCDEQPLHKHNINY